MAVLTALRTVTPPHGEIIPALGRALGTCRGPTTAVGPTNVGENRLALDMHLSAPDFAELDYMFPPPPTAAARGALGRRDGTHVR
jgi:hypothetical protein